MLLLWAGNLVVKNVQFTHIVPNQHPLTLTAKKITGKKRLAIEDVKGQYADWLFTAKQITLDTLKHAVWLGKMSMNCKKPSIQIHAQSGVLNLKTYSAGIQNTHLIHRNMAFTCPKANYDHQAQKIICFNGKMVITSKNPHLNKAL
jgi:hypothetical protein